MTSDAGDSLSARVDAIYRADSRRVLATLIRLLGDFDLAEEAVHDAFCAALERWPHDGVPANPRTWLISAGRFSAIDRLRRKARFDSSLSAIVEQLGNTSTPPTDFGDGPDIEDDRLRLLFTCCHPALPRDARIALTLREIAGLTTEEIARAFLTTPPTVAQRIVRAKGKIRDAGIPYQVPSLADLPERLNAVLQVVYLVFNEGYSATAGASVTRQDLSAEAIRLGRLLVALMPTAETMGLLALMLLHDSRRTSRTSPDGEIILLEAQDRRRWNRAQIDEGLELVARSLAGRRVGSYALQAGIAAIHAEAATPAETDWAQIVALYDVLLRVEPQAVIELNRAAAIAMRDGPAAGLALIDELLVAGELANYSLAHSARADLLRRLDRIGEAVAAYRRALELSEQAPQRRFLEGQIARLKGE